MRVLLANSEKGMRGGEYQTSALASGLMETGCQVALVSAPGAEIGSSMPEGVEIFNVVYEQPPLYSPLRLRGIVRSWKPDILHAQTSRAHSHLRLASMISRGFPPLVVSRRVDFDISGGLAGIFKYRRGVEHYIAISEAAASRLADAGVKREQISVVRSGVDIARLSNLKPDGAFAGELGLEGSGSVIGTVASFEKEKGYPVLLEAARKVIEKHKSAHFILRGSGSMEGYIRDYIHRARLENSVSLVGSRVPMEKVLSLLDVFVLASMREGLSTALISAIAAGIPSVASNTGGIPEVISGGAGVLVEPGNSTVFASAISDIITSSSLRKELSEKAGKRAYDFDIRETVKRTYEIYRSITDIGEGDGIEGV